ncbi:hypothetical protein [Bacillus sp. FJAT-49736]|uniref:hypothetical protein n=1 Tax=Bacillus sp. FJAT-49736 TaxID=2833582 RepID=UPI001BC8DC39|nr:hypothetical protein [Bacillus sp. FJAT-49736]MBS4173369.1 hypothetical protein [Bacillus sp. FJAT-49736]
MRDKTRYDLYQKCPSICGMKDKTRQNQRKNVFHPANEGQNTAKSKGKCLSSSE